MRRPLQVKPDERGYFVELWREDWLPSFYHFDEHWDLPDVKQSMLSVSRPGVVRAWHAHVRSQDDFLVVIKGEAQIVYYDAGTQQFVEKRVNGETPELVYVPGTYWHGTQALTETWTIYFVTQLYDYKNPDELRLPPDHEFDGAGRFEWDTKKQ